MVVSLFLTHLLLEVASPNIFPPSPFLPLMKKIQGLKALHGATSVVLFCFCEWNAMIFFPSHIICLFVFYSMDSCEFLALLCQKREKHCISIALGRSIALHTYIHIQIYLMMMVIWIDTSLSIQKLSGFLKKSLLSRLSKCTQFEIQVWYHQSQKGEIVRDRGSNMKELEEVLSFLHAQIFEGILYWLLHLSLSFFMCTSCITM